MNKLILLSMFLTIFVSSYNCEVSSSLRKQLLDLHNKYRRDIAQGKVPGQPSASNMLELKWNDEAAKKAQNYANQCIFNHDPYKDRLYSNYDWVGQNIAYWSKGSDTEGVTMWFDEFKGYDFVNNDCSIFTCLHYTMMVWAETKEFGCGLNNCKSKGLGDKFLICNYAPGGNLNDLKPYKEGKACETCPSGMGCRDGLCV